jgi:hypothetical protein
VKLKEITHDLLEKQIFPEARRSQTKRSKGMRKTKESKKQAILESLICQELGEAYVVSSTDENPFPLTIDTDRDLILENNESTLLPNARSKRELIKYIAYAFELSMGTPEEKRRERFYQLLSEFVKLGLL